MALVCPVCGHEQADAIHLANHLAVTASLGREAHRSWLERHAPDWSEMGPEELGPIVAEAAVSGDCGETVEWTGQHDEPGRLGEAVDSASNGQSVDSHYAGTDPSLDEETRRTLQRARELTSRREHSTGGDVAEGEESDTGATDVADADEGVDAGNDG